MNTQTILVVTIGSTDIKALGVHHESSGGSRYPMEIFNQRAFCELLEKEGVSIGAREKNARFTLLRPKDLKSTNALIEELAQAESAFSHHQLRHKQSETDHNNRFSPALEVYEGVLKTKGKSSEFDFKPEAPELIAAKLLPVVSRIFENKSNITTAIVLNTNRSKERKHAKKEPYAVGPIIAKWLAEVLNLEHRGEFQFQDDAPIMNSAFYLNYLTGTTEADGEKQNFPVTREAMQTIDCMLKHLEQVYRKQGITPQVLYSPGGGLPQFKSQIEAACRLYFDKVEHWVSPDNEHQFNSSQYSENIDLYPAPDTSYRARRQIIEQIESGNFEGAATIASAFYNDDENGEQPQLIQSDQHWAKAVIAVAGWFQGKVSLKELKSQLPSILDKFHEEKEMPNSLWCGFKVEAALRQGNLHDAIRYTCDIRDIALYDLLGKVVGKGNFDLFHSLSSTNDAGSLQPQLDQLNKEIGANKVDDKGETVSFKYTNLVLKEKARYKIRLNTYNPMVPGQKAGKSTLEQLLGKKKAASIENYCSNRIILIDALCLAQDGNIPEALTHPLNIYEATLKRPLAKGESTARNYRNTITHGFLPPEMTKQAKQHFMHERIGFWAQTPNKNTMHFLNQPIFTELYARLDSDNTPADCYKQLVKALTDKLRHARIDGKI